MRCKRSKTPPHRSCAVAKQVRSQYALSYDVQRVLLEVLDLYNFGYMHTSMHCQIMLCADSRINHDHIIHSRHQIPPWFACKKLNHILEHIPHRWQGEALSDIEDAG